jgi:hypothetical protein
MKKIASPRLRLGAETIRPLAGAALHRAAGASDSPYSIIGTCPPSIPPDPPPPAPYPSGGGSVAFPPGHKPVMQ